MVRGVADPLNDLILRCPGRRYGKGKRRAVTLLLLNSSRERVLIR